MNRRTFMKYCALFASNAALGRLLLACAHGPAAPAPEYPPIAPMNVVDAHAHPDQFFTERPRKIDASASMDSIRESGILGCSFAAVGDMESLRRGYPGHDFEDTRRQLSRVLEWAEAGSVLIARTEKDFTAGGRRTPRAVLSIEGGDCFQGELSKLDAFHQSGVRLVTLMHYTVNDIGDIMTEAPRNKGLTAFGKQIVERMQRLGMMVDVAHAHPLTLEGIATVSSKPLIDSHTNPAPLSRPPQGSEKMLQRMRSWDEMEMIAKTGGLVCTWPLKSEYGGWQRLSLEDWARETVEIKSRLGMDHVGLGTDGGGQLPRRISSFKDYRDLGKLAAALANAGLSEDDIRAYMGGNFLRVFRTCVG